MSKNIEIKSVFKIKNVGDNVSISGWVKTFRSNRFIALNDGSCLEDIQCVINFEEIDNEILSKINTGTSLNIEGEIVKSQGKGQSIEILVKKLIELDFKISLNTDNRLMSNTSVKFELDNCKKIGIKNPESLLNFSASDSFFK